MCDVACQQVCLAGRVGHVAGAAKRAVALGMVQGTILRAVECAAPAQAKTVDPASLFEVERADTHRRAVVEALDDPDRRREVEVERRLLARVEGGCRVAAGAWCRSLDDGQLALTAILEVDGHLRRATMRDSNGDRLARTVARQLTGHRSTERT